MLDMPSEECGVCVWFLLLHSGALHTNDLAKLKRSGQCAKLLPQVDQSWRMLAFCLLIFLCFLPM